MHHDIIKMLVLDAITEKKKDDMCSNSKIWCKPLAKGETTQHISPYHYVF